MRFVISIIVQLLQIISSVFFITSVIRLNVLPTKYIIVLSVTMLTLFAITLLLQLSKTWKRVLGITLSILFTIGLGVGAYFLISADTTIGDLTTPDEYYDKIVIAVRADSNHNTIQDIKDCLFGVQYALQGELIRATKNQVESEINGELSVQEYDTIVEQIYALMSNDVDAIIYNDAYSNLFVESLNMDDYHKQVKIIYECQLTKSDVERLSNMDKSPTNIIEQEIQTDITQPLNTDSTDVFTVYLSGIDVYGKISQNSRSDVNIIAMVNPSKNKILLINTPRDYFVQIPGISGDKKDKLTHAGLYGVDASIESLENLYGIRLDYYLRVNLTSFEDIIDALGGVSVYSAYSFSSQDYTYVEGYNEMDGEKALVFCRERKYFANGDRQRGKNQQEVIKAVIKKACSPAIITSIGEILEHIKFGVNMNIPEELIQEMVKKQLDDGKEWQIITISADGTGEYTETYSMPGVDVYVMKPDEKTIKNIKTAIAEIYKD